MLARPNSLVNTKIFISNSSLDGFREGDGDLMDKLATQLNHLAVSSVRIVKYPVSVANARPPEQLLVLDALPAPPASLDNLSEDEKKILHYVTQYPASHKILYIGSRISQIWGEDQKKINRLGSGSIFSAELLQELRKNKVKIVVCCLELKFLTRSFSNSLKLYEMLRNHLRYADAIHFLTERDQEFFQQELIPKLSAQSHLVDASLNHVEELIKSSSKISRGVAKTVGGEAQEMFSILFAGNFENYNNYFKNFNANESSEIIKNLKTALCVYAPGICTAKSQELEINEEKMLQREKNIMVFGLIRGHKGVMEGIELAKLLYQKNSPSSVYIVGKIIGCSGLSIKKVFHEIFDAASLKENNINLKAEVSACFRSKDINHSFQELFARFVNMGIRKQANVEVAFNVPEENLKQYIDKCRYALKLDIKGFAENASCIISTSIGMCLPTLTQRGLLTPHALENFGEAIAILPGELTARKGVMRPAVIETEQILEVISEPDESYRKRLQAVIRLRQSGQFSVERLADSLMQQVFSPLVQQSQQQAISPRSNSAFFAPRPASPHGEEKGEVPIKPNTVSLPVYRA